MKVLSSLTLFALLILFFVSCGYPHSKSVLQTLPSGKQIKFLSSHEFHTPQGLLGIEYKYETELSTKNLPALRVEVLQIWEVFQIELKIKKAGVGVIIAREPPKKWGSFPDYQSHKFVFLKKNSGEWQLQY